jgi:uncharacterized integral membrane protein
MGFKMARRDILKLIAALAIFVFLILFAVQNFHPRARVHLLFWRTGGTPLSIIIFLSVLIGVLIAAAELLPRLLRSRKRAQAAEAQLARLKTVTMARTATRTENLV